MHSQHFFIALKTGEGVRRRVYEASFSDGNAGGLSWPRRLFIRSSVRAGGHGGGVRDLAVLGAGCCVLGA